MASWTEEQHDAIYTEGSDILVSAAAGSGKTAVLVERIIQKLVREENPIDIDSLLVVTFTNAAAQEMRNRVSEALEEALAENPKSVHLKKQLSLLQRASISTLHSFCLEVLRQYAYLLDIDPAFRIADTMEVDMIKQEVIEDLFETWYGAEGEAQQDFFAVVDRFSSDRSDVDVEDIILRLYNFAEQNPWPENWLDRLHEAYDVPEHGEESQLEWLEIMKQETHLQLEGIGEEIQLAHQIVMEPDGPYQYAEAIEADLENLKQAREYLDSWEDLQVFMKESKFKSLSRKKTECDEGKKEKVKQLRDSYKKSWNDMKEKWFNRNLQGHIADMRELAPVVKKLAELVKQFKTRFAEEKKERALVDFSDLEHYCLQLLLDGASTENNLIPSSVANHYKNQFSEVLVDEYQDINLVQETILALVSDQKKEGNRFMVGDVKQSIYRFRHAEPSLFIQKYKQFAEEGRIGKRIDLARNFRSRKEVLNAANYVFRQILDEELGDIQYDADAELIYGNKMYEDLALERPEPELLIIDRKTEEKEKSQEEADDHRDLEKAQLESRLYAEKIKNWIGTEGERPMQIYDKAKGIQRDAQYRDIVILLRSMTQAPTIVDELKRQGIPVYAELSTGYFEAIEVKVMISLLQVIDNPRQDIPLASVLKSPIVGLNEDELTKIRLSDKNAAFYDALRAFTRQNNSDTSQRTEQFLHKLQAFRIASRQGALSELIWEIYRETGYFDFVGGMPGGRQRQANLRALYDRARSYENTSFRGLFRFLRMIERMKERGDDLGAARALSEQEDVIRIMTIHSSKGLEFPAVILGAMDKQFNMMDLNKKYLLHKEFGFATKYINPEKRIIYPTLFFHALRQVEERELLAEEMRVLYVALTRAKEKLVMVGNVADFEKKQQKWQPMLNHGNWVLPTYFRMRAKSYLDWVGPALIRHPNSQVLRAEGLQDPAGNEMQGDPSRWEVSVLHGKELIQQEEHEEETDEELKDAVVNWKPVSAQDETLRKKVDERLSFTYPYKEAQRTRAKQTVTEIKRQREVKDEYASDQLVKPFRSPIVKRPAFMQKEKIVTAAEKGTAMHTLMQHLPFTKRLTEREISEYAEALVDREILTKTEADVIDAAAISEFFKTEIADEMIEKQASIFREAPFSLTLPASEVYDTWTGPEDEEVLVQGVIDCLIPTEDGWIIVDYKTDQIKEAEIQEMKETLSKRYEIQMALYRYAVQTIWKQPVENAYLYFFDNQLLVKVPERY